MTRLYWVSATTTRLLSSWFNQLFSQAVKRPKGSGDHQPPWEKSYKVPPLVPFHTETLVAMQPISNQCQPPSSPSWELAGIAPGRVGGKNKTCIRCECRLWSATRWSPPNNKNYPKVTRGRGYPLYSLLSLVYVRRHPLCVHHPLSYRTSRRSQLVLKGLNKPKPRKQPAKALKCINFNNIN